jgi:MFS transporter, AAHS family, 3-hydroxyphenylpropionic acid transporter
MSSTITSASTDAQLTKPASQGVQGTGIIAAIVLLQIYQGYTLSIAGVASPWIAASFHLDQASLARLFAWMSTSAVGSLVLARMADRVGRRRIILASLILVPVFNVGAALARAAALFAVFEILISALLGGSVSSAIVLLAEELPVKRRSSGQAAAAFASAVGGILPYPVIPVLIGWGFSWRWMLAPSIAGIGLVWPMLRMLPEPLIWARTSSTPGGRRTSFYDIFHPLYRRRAVTLLVCAALDTMAGTAVNGWLYFDAVSVIGLLPARASMLVVIGMGVGMLGFPAGAWTSERFGRVPTVAYFGGAAWLGALAFYHGPPSSFAYPTWWLAGAYCWFKVGSSIMTVGANSAATELLPAPLRTTMVGWQMITGAVFSVLAQVLIAALIGPMGGLTNVIKNFSLLGIPSAIIFGLFIDETRGLSLEKAAREDQWAELSGVKPLTESADGGRQTIG